MIPTSMDPRYIRNFSIIAHIDHGKSTLADRFLELTGALQAREMEAQVLDAMDLERERGITIKAHPVRLNYTTLAGEQYVLNLIDTPGHVDFSYEVTRSLAACEGRAAAGGRLAGCRGADARQRLPGRGQQPRHHPRHQQDRPAQRAARRVQAADRGHHRPRQQHRHPGERQGGHRHARHPRGHRHAVSSAGRRSRRAAEGADLRFVVRRLPRRGDRGPRDRRRDAAEDEDPADGRRRRTSRWTTSASFRPRRSRSTELGVGEVGFVVANIKRVGDAKLGDTVTEIARPTTEPFPGFKELKPMVFAGLYPVESHQYPELREALDKLRLNDASFFYEPETSAALGFGFRCGFLGLLHMEIVQERLEREYDMDLVTTAPGVLYRVTTTDGEVQEIDSPAKLPDAGRITKLEEPVITATILTPSEHVGAILQLCQDKRGIQKKLEYSEVGPRAHHLRAAVQRGGARLLRQAEDLFEGLRLPGLPRHRLLGVAAREDGHPGERRARRRAVDHRPPRRRLRSRPRAGVEDAAADSPADVRDRHPGLHRQPCDRARKRQGAAQERARQVLWWGHHAQAQAPREAERGEEAHETRGARGDPAGSVPGGPQDRRDWIERMAKAKPRRRPNPSPIGSPPRASGSSRCASP